MNSLSKINLNLKTLPRELKEAKYPLTKLNLSQLEGIQSNIPLFHGVKLEDVSFITKRFETLNLFRGCNVGCSHCLKNATPHENKTILYEDLTRFLDGFKQLNERLGFNVLNGNKYLNIIDDSNPSDIPIIGLSGKHSVIDAIGQIFEKLNLPILFVTSGWNKNSKYAQTTSTKLAQMAQKTPQMFESIDISINPFTGIMEKSRQFLKNGNKENADFFRNLYTSQMANTITTFFKLFESGKSNIIYRHAPNIEGNELVNENATRKLYEDIYAKVKNLVGSAIEQVPELVPETLTRFDKSHLIEASGRGRRFFTQTTNYEEQQKLIDEALKWESMTPQQQYETLKDFALKCIDIDGKVYATMPATEVKSISAPIELTVPTKIRLNYQNKTPSPQIFSDIDLE